jgi:simple sugar transport system permease protein
MRNILQKIKLPILALVVALFFSGLLIAFSDPKVLALKGDPLSMIAKAFSIAGAAYWALFRGSIYDPQLADSGLLGGLYPLSETIVVATPLILTGLAVALAFKAGLFNIGAQGQFIVGAIGASYVGFTFELPIVLHTLAAIAAAIVCAGLYGGFVGLLKARTGAHEVIVTIMLNYVASYFLLWLLSTKAFLREGRMDPIAPEVLESSRLPRLAGQDFRLHSGIFIALLAALAIWWLLNRSTLGFKFRAVGANAKASRTAGISVAKSTTFVMVISGALAGLGGAVHILGADHALTNEVGGSFGFDAITVALLGRATPLGTVLAALLFGALRAGGLTMQASTETPLDIVLIIQALVVLFIAAPAVIKAIFRLKNVEEGQAIGSKGWNG